MNTGWLFANGLFSNGEPIYAGKAYAVTGAFTHNTGYRVYLSAFDALIGAKGSMMARIEYPGRRKTVDDEEFDVVQNLRVLAYVDMLMHIRAFFCKAVHTYRLKHSNDKIITLFSTQEQEALEIVYRYSVGNELESALESVYDSVKDITGKDPAIHQFLFFVSAPDAYARIGIANCARILCQLIPNAEKYAMYRDFEALCTKITVSLLPNSFDSYINYATDVVNSWPDWKKNAL